MIKSYFNTNKSKPIKLIMQAFHFFIRITRIKRFHFRTKGTKNKDRFFSLDLAVDIDTEMQGFYSQMVTLE